METKMDRKINVIARIGRILTTILAVFMILAAVATAIGVGVVASMPKDSLSVSVTGTADITAKGEILESVVNAVVDATEGGDGKIYLGESDGKTAVAVGDMKGAVPEGVTAEKTEKGISLDVSSYQLDITVSSVLRALIFWLLDMVCAIVVLFMIRALMKAIEQSETPFCEPVIKKMKAFGFSLIPFAVFSGTTDGAWSTLLSGSGGGINLTVVFGVLVVFMLVMIFSYGAELQKQSDETL